MHFFHFNFYEKNNKIRIPHYLIYFYNIYHLSLIHI